MKMIIRITLLTALLISAAAAMAQTKEVTPKPDAAWNKLQQISSEHAKDKPALDAADKAANDDFNKKLATFNDQIGALQKQLHDQEENDKRFKPLLDKIDDINKQIAAARQQALSDLAATTGSLRQKVGVEEAQIPVLIDVVKAENDGALDSAQYDPNTQKWTETAQSPKK